MEAYKSSCSKCGAVYFWTGFKTGIGKTPAQLEQMRRDQTVCRECGADGLKTGLDHESETGRVFDAQMNSLVNVIKGLKDGAS